MSFFTFHGRLHSTILMSCILMIVILPTSVRAAGSATFEFRPHCEGDDLLHNSFGGPSPDVVGMTKLAEGTCRAFEVRDPMTLQTDRLKAGDILDIDIMVNNPDAKLIQRFRAWVAYDTTILQGLDATISPHFSIPTPGETGFIVDEGTVKLSGATTNPVSVSRFSIAHIRFQVLKDTQEGTPLSFVDITGDVNAKTGIFEGASQQESNILSSTIGSLFVRFMNSTSSQGASSLFSNNSVSSSTATTNSRAPHDAATSTATISTTTSVGSIASTISQKAFNLLQVLGLRITTEGSSVFLAWDLLPSSELSGYNIYYGTVSGRYIQRRSVEKSANSLTIRALPVGTTYYFAVRGYNAAGEETSFSQEVGISVGNPRTSTSPLSANSLPTKTPENGGTVSGETGINSMLLMAILSCAAVGTFIAVRRQLQFSSAS